MYFKHSGNIFIIIKNNEVIGYMYRNGTIKINNGELTFEDIDYIYKYLKNIIGVI